MPALSDINFLQWTFNCLIFPFLDAIVYRANYRLIQEFISFLFFFFLFSFLGETEYDIIRRKSSFEGIAVDDDENADCSTLVSKFLSYRYYV